MRLTTVPVDPRLRPWVHRLWVFESPGGLPEADLRVVVPNGRHRLVVPWHNGLLLQDGGSVARVIEPVLVGLWDRPVAIGSEPRATTSIGLELTSAALARAFAVRAPDLVNGTAPLGEVGGTAGRRLVEAMLAAPSPHDAARILHTHLRDALLADPRPTVVDRSLALMAAGGHRMAIADVADEVGYSRRRLSALFLDQTGLPPAHLQAILAFEAVYRRLGHDRSSAALRDHALRTYADQPHFVRRFREFTGMPPTRFLERGNEFGLLFYRGTG